MDYNPFLPEVQQNPYPYYAYLRCEAPVYWVESMQAWAVSRYDDVLPLFKNPQVFSSGVLYATLLGDSNPFPPEAPAIVSIDPPSHTRLRKLANRAFTPRRVISLATHIREITRQLIEPLMARREFDLVGELASPLPVIVIAELLGVAHERQQDFKRWTSDIMQATNGGAVTQAEREKIRRSIADVHTYFRAAIAAYHQTPGDNLISDLVRAEEEKQVLTAEEVQSLVVFLLIAGSETTTNLISNAILALLAHPKQMAQVRNNPELIPNVVEETLRYDGPIQLFVRQATQDVELGGTRIPAGALVLPLLGSANHDERKFSDPERFDIMRNVDGHIGFGFGIHFCLGAQLARLEAQIALEELLGRSPHLTRKDDRLTRIESVAIRGPKTLPLAVG